MEFMCTTVDTSFVFTKKSNVAKYFFDICNAEMAQSQDISIYSGEIRDGIVRIV